MESTLITADNEVKKVPKLRKKRHCWNAQKKTSFLRIIDVFRPFDAKHGSITAAWQKVAEQYNTIIEETEALCAKSARMAFEDLIAAYRREEGRSRGLTGVNEEHTEEMDLLQSLDQMVRDAQSVVDKAAGAKHKKVYILELSIPIMKINTLMLS
jgi:hypothetical protein